MSKILNLISGQALRFLRLFAAAFVAQLVIVGTGSLGWKTLAAAAVASLEVVVRQVWPVQPQGPTP